MELKYNLIIDNETFTTIMNKMINRCYKVLCYREEEKEWEKFLETVILELVGLQRLFNQDSFLFLIAKLESLFILTNEEDFLKFRRVIFECIGILDEVKYDAKLH